MTIAEQQAHGMNSIRMNNKSLKIHGTLVGLTTAKGTSVVTILYLY